MTDFTAEEGRTFESKLMNFRVDDNRILFGPGMVDKYFDSLGGFDLDDKALTKIMTYKNNKGEKKLIFGMFRQPTGPEETIFAKANLDETTVRSLFGNEDFKKILSKYRSGGTGDYGEQAEELNEILFNDKRYKDLNAEKAESLIARIYDFNEKEGGVRTQIS